MDGWRRSKKASRMKIKLSGQRSTSLKQITSHKRILKIKILISLESHTPVFWFMLMNISNSRSKRRQNRMPKPKKKATVSKLNQDRPLLTSSIMNIIRMTNKVSQTLLKTSQRLSSKQCCPTPTFTPVWLKCASTDKSMLRTTIWSSVPKSFINALK